ncbi:MAG TPA: DUF1552 domain-containing protein [Polyangia bacterium]|nr:DUF1552 domain-containing protein [Polyangia bacterium]
MKLSRRTLTKSAGASLLQSPFYNLLRPGQARAAGKAKRLFIFHSQPCDDGVWKPGSVTGESSFTFPEMFQPFNEIKEHIVMLDGLSPKQPQDNHYSPHALTGVGREGRADKGIISIDQYIGDQLEKRPDKRPIKSLILGSGAASEAVFYRNSARLTTIASPLSAYNTVFSNVGGAGGPSPADLLKRRKSVLDVVRADVTELQGALGAGEKQKLELHLESIRQFETRLADPKASMETACAKPMAPSDDLSSAAKKTLADMAHLDLVVNAFACDITRVGAVQWGNSHTWQFDTPTGLRNELHMGIIHVGKRAEAVKIETWLAGQFAGVIKRLKSIPEPDGSGTLLDNTLVVWTRDFGEANAHGSYNMKFVLAQGTGGYLKTNPGGRYIKGVSGNKRQERILLNLAEAMGVTTFDGFGDIGADFKPNKVPLSELRA